MLKPLMVLALVFALATPAEAAIVYLKDGRQLQGSLQVEETGLVVTQPEGQPQSVPYTQIQGVSLDGEPLYPVPTAIGGNWATWAGFVANLVAIGASVYALSWAAGRQQTQAP